MLKISRVLEASPNPEWTGGHRRLPNVERLPVDGASAFDRFRAERAALMGTAPHGMSGTQDSSWTVLGPRPRLPSTELMPPGLRRGTLRRAVVDHVLPQLSLRHRPAGSRDGRSFPEFALGLAELVQRTDLTAARSMLGHLRRSVEASATRLRDVLLSETAAVVEEDYLCDGIDRFERTTAICNLRTLAMELTSLSPAPVRRKGGGSACIWSTDPDRVDFPSILHMCHLLERGWWVEKKEGFSAEDVLRHLKKSKVDVVFCIVHRKESLEACRSACKMFRRASKNRRIRIAGLGPGFGRTELTLPQMALDALWSSPEDAVDWASGPKSSDQTMAA